MIRTFGLRGRLIAGATCLSVLVYLAIVLLHILRDRDIAPFLDMVGVEYFLDKSFLPRMNFFNAFTMILNQHRPVFPLYVFAVDHVFFASRALFPLLLSLASIAGMCLICFHRLAPAIPDAATRFGFLLLLPCVMFWPAQFENLVYPLQLMFSFALLCICAMFSLTASLDARMGAARERADRISLGILLPLIFVAAFSMGWGLVADFILGIFVLWRRWPVLWAAPVLAAVALTTGVYAMVWKTIPYDYGASSFAQMIIAAIEYFLVFIGSPLRWLMGALVLPVNIALSVAGCLGGIGVLAAVWSLARRPKPGADRTRATDAAVSYAQLLVLFGLGAAFVTLIGRFQFGPLQGSTSRYLFASCLFWIALPFTLPRFRAGLPAMRWLPLSAMLGVGIAVASSTPVYFGFMANRAATNRLGSIAAVMGEDGVEVPPRLLPFASVLDEVFADYAAHGTSVYADPWPHWLGQAAAQALPATTALCQGWLDDFRSVPGSSDHRVDGWLWQPGHSAGGGWLALVGRNGRIIGLATTGFIRPDVAFALQTEMARRAGFAGFLRGDRKDFAEIYGWFGGGNWCRLALAP